MDTRIYMHTYVLINWYVHCKLHIVFLCLVLPWINYSSHKICLCVTHNYYRRCEHSRMLKKPTWDTESWGWLRKKQWRAEAEVEVMMIKSSRIYWIILVSCFNAQTSSNEHKSNKCYYTSSHSNGKLLAKHTHTHTQTANLKSFKI